MLVKTHTLFKRLTFRSDYENGRQLMVSYLCKVLTIHKICFEFAQEIFFLSSYLVSRSHPLLSFPCALFIFCSLSLTLSVCMCLLVSLSLSASTSRSQSTVYIAPYCSLPFASCVVVCFKRNFFFIILRLLCCKSSKISLDVLIYNIKTHRLSFASDFSLCVLLRLYYTNNNDLVFNERPLTSNK